MPIYNIVNTLIRSVMYMDMTQKEIAKLLNVSERTIRNWKAKGQLELKLKEFELSTYRQEIDTLRNELQETKRQLQEQAKALEMLVSEIQQLKKPASRKRKKKEEPDNIKGQLYIVDVNDYKEINI